MSVGASSSSAFRVLLDGKPLRTPGKQEVILRSRPLAQAIAAEWAAQHDHIDPVTMPLTRLVNSTVEGVAGREADVRADIVKYAANDLLCYRASGPEELVRRQAQAWDPVLAWSRDTLGARFATAEGIMPVAQTEPARKAVLRAIEDLDAFQLTAVHVMTTLTGSALLALAHARGRLGLAEAWAAAHVDEEWQESQWGVDTEARARRERRWVEMQAASRLLQLLR